MKLTKEEKNWILYDVGNSAFTLLIATIMPLYFNYLAEQAGLSSVDYLAYWGYAASVATLFVVFIGPVFGTLADTKGFKKPVFSVALAVGAAACVLTPHHRQGSECHVQHREQQGPPAPIGPGSACHRDERRSWAACAEGPERSPKHAGAHGSGGGEGQLGAARLTTA